MGLSKIPEEPKIYSFLFALVTLQLHFTSKK